MHRCLPLVLLFAVACTPLSTGPAPESDPPPEPEVFAVIRASNSKAAVEQLRDRHAEEVLHARLLEARIGELIAAEEGLAAEHRERLTALQTMRDQVRKLGDEQAATGRAIDSATKAQSEGKARLEQLQQENAALEAAIAADEAKRAELEARKKKGG